MRTIEQASVEYSKEQYDHDPIMRFQCETYFEAGIEFAQRWIPVEEELPKEMVCVLLKTEYEGHIIFDVGFLMDGKFKTKNSKPTHWRCIELK